MPVKKILLLGDPQLYEPSLTLEPEDAPLARLVAKDLEDTLLAFRSRVGFGRAIAAPQIGAQVRMIYMNIAGDVTVFVNPVISFPDEEQFELWDDCMSFPNLEVWLKRYKRCHVDYYNLDWEPCAADFEGDLSELFQHEYDHLDGILATQRVLHEKGFRIKPAATPPSVETDDAGTQKEGPIRLGKLTEAMAREACTWRYSGIYSVYNLSDWEVVVSNCWELANEASRDENFVSLLRGDENQLVGFGRIQASEQAVSLGIGLKPVLCGKGLGTEAMTILVEEAKKRHPGKTIGLEVRKFNERARKCYEKIGFVVESVYTKETVEGYIPYIYMVLK